MSEGGDHEYRKIHLRRQLLAARRNFPAGAAAHLAAQVCARALGLPSVRAAEAVVAYAATGGEVDPWPIVANAIERGAEVYYPQHGGPRPSFVRSGPLSSVPAPDGRELLSDGRVIVVLVPGVAFSASGVRLGRGGGWYDRALRAHPSAVRVGLAYDWQVLPGLPEDPWDVRMHAVVTESRLLTADPQR